MGDTINHFRAVVKGNYAASQTSLANETWSVGVSLYGQLSSVPAIGTPDSSFEAASQLISLSDANGSYQSNYLAEGGTDDINPASYLKDQFRAPLTTLIATSSAYAFCYCKATSVVLYPMKVVSGKFKVCTTSYGPAKAVWTPATPPPGPATNLSPPEVSSVVSFRTANATRRGRGRVYQPGMGTGCFATDGTIGSTARTAQAGAWATFLAAIQYTQGVGPDLEVAPVVIGEPGDTFFKIDRVSVGNVADSQRRRRNALTETYQDAAVTY